MTRLPCECDAGTGGLDAERGCEFGETDGAAGDLRPAVDERAAQAGGGVFEQLRGDGHLAPGYGHDLAIVDCAVEPVMSRGGYSGIHTELDVEFECIAYSTFLLQNSMASIRSPFTNTVIFIVSGFCGPIRVCRASEMRFLYKG